MDTLQLPNAKFSCFTRGLAFYILNTNTLKQNRRLVAASLTGISPRPMLVGAPHDALRASNAGVSLRVPMVMANRVPLCF